MRMKTRFRKVRFLQMRVKKVQRGKLHFAYQSIALPKLQTPNFKLQGNIKLQIPNAGWLMFVKRFAHIVVNELALIRNETPPFAVITL